jgi:proteasome lid subunit RPN8/RPN11
MHLRPGLAEATQDALRIGSAGRRESIVIWAGRPLSATSVDVTHLVLPVFESSARHLVIPQPERAILAEYLRDERLLAFADLHTHPEDAFLSEADKARPFSARDGFFAVVVPDFARHPPGQGWRFYTARAGSWSEVPGRKAVDGWPP